jgi:hypothetical protein
MSYLPCAYSGCKKTGSLICGSCKSVRYCTPTCQKSHWKTHKPTCKAIASALNQATDEIKNRAREALQTKSLVDKGFIFSNDADEEWRSRKAFAMDYINQVADEPSKSRLNDAMKEIDNEANAEDSIKAFDSNPEIQGILQHLFAGSVQTTPDVGAR